MNTTLAILAVACVIIAVAVIKGGGCAPIILALIPGLTIGLFVGWAYAYQKGYGDGRYELLAARGCPAISERK
jgi:hypothetical protein